MGASTPPCAFVEQLPGVPCLLPLELAVGNPERAVLHCKHLLLHAGRRGFGNNLLLQQELVGRELLPGCLLRGRVRLDSNHRTINRAIDKCIYRSIVSIYQLF